MDLRIDTGRLERERRPSDSSSPPGIYTACGFRDSVNVQTSTISDHYLALDQGMIMAAIANATLGETFRDSCRVPSSKRSDSLLEPEEFNAAPAR